jgi:hypothetical protein
MLDVDRRSSQSLDENTGIGLLKLDRSRSVVYNFYYFVFNHSVDQHILWAPSDKVQINSSDTLGMLTEHKENSGV